jgi:uracil-DNA glycosylase family 4
VALDPQLQGSLAARIRYFRDLGVFDFYRRGEPMPAAETIVASQTVTGTATELSTPTFLKKTPEMPRAVSSSPPRTPSAIQLIPGSAPLAPELHAAALQAIRNEIGDCQRCPLAPTRNKLVFGDGDPNARLMFVGEGPGADEDAQGLPFVGRGGQLLNNMITAMGLKREEVYIANIVKCRPPKNRVPEPIEANTCKPFLFQQIEVIQPEIIVALGSTAATYLLGAKASLSSLRGRIHHAFHTKLIVTYHPAFLLRDPTQKKEAWKDLRLAMAELGLQPKRTPS